MNTVEEIMAAINKLPLPERARLERMLHRWTDDEWDDQMLDDAASGRFHKLIADLDREIDSGKYDL